MPKRRRTASAASKTYISDDIKIKVEKDCEEEESLVIQNFQPASTFDEKNKIKKEAEINYELTIEDRPEITKTLDEDGPTSDDECESSSGNGENSNQKVPILKISNTEIQIKLEPEDESIPNSQETSKSFSFQNCEDPQSKEEFLIVKEEVEDSGVNLMKIEVRISKVDMEIAKPYAKKFKFDQKESKNGALASGSKKYFERSKNLRKSGNRNSIINEPKTKSFNNEDRSTDGSESNREVCGDGVGSYSENFNSCDESTDGGDVSCKKLEKRSTSNDSQGETSEQKYFRIFENCKLSSKKSSESTKNSNYSDNILVAKPSDSRKSRKSRSRNLKSSTTVPTNMSEKDLKNPASEEAEENASQNEQKIFKNSGDSGPENKGDIKYSDMKSLFFDNNEGNNFELYSRLSIEDVKDPRLAAIVTNSELKNEENLSSSVSSSKIRKPQKNSTAKQFQCTLCPKSFDKKISLYNHQAFHTSSDFPCIKCGLIFKSQRTVDNHECPICKYCGKKFKSKAKVIRHVTYVHSEQSKLELFKCDLCGKELKYKISIEKHMIEHLEVTKALRFKCEICNKSFKKRMGLQNHQILHIKATLSCKNCGMKFKKQKPFEQHKCLICKHCPKHFSSKTKLRDHVRNIHTDMSELDLFICDFCGKCFKYRPSIIRHVMDHREEARYKCESCGKKWKSDIALRDHIRMCHATESVTCKICFKKMKPQCIYQHMKYVHTVARNFECKLCNATFKTKEKLKRHLDTHNRKFKCEYCSRKFSSQYELTEHVRWHENPDVYQCKVCKKSFSTRTSLNTHAKLHKGIVRNLQCPHCPFKTHRQESIKYHLTTHEKRDKKLEMKKNWLKCEKCGALLKNKATLWGHYRKVHPTEKFTCDLCGIHVKTKHSLKHHIEGKHMT